MSQIEDHFSNFEESEAYAKTTSSRSRCKPHNVKDCQTCSDAMQRAVDAFNGAGKLEIPKVEIDFSRKGCIVVKCTSDKFSKDLCGKHYQQWRDGRIDIGIDYKAQKRSHEKNRICDVPGCKKPHKAFGKCKKHYKHLNYKTVRRDIVEERKEYKTTKVPQTLDTRLTDHMKEKSNSHGKWLAGFLESQGKTEQEIKERVFIAKSNLIHGAKHAVEFLESEGAIKEE